MTVEGSASALYEADRTGVVTTCPVLPQRKEGPFTMGIDNAITIPLDLPRNEACAFAELLKRTSYDDCLRRSNRRKQYPDGREEADVMWAALRLVENQFGEAGFAPR